MLEFGVFSRSISYKGFLPLLQNWCVADMLSMSNANSKVNSVRKNPGDISP